MPRGGYQQPSNPAPVSGPGGMSRRTDTGQRLRELPDAQYGEAATFREDQQGAPLAQTPTGGGSGAPANPPPVVPFGAPTQSPDMPVTAGADAGAGPGSSALGLVDTSSEDAILSWAPYLPTLEWRANQPDASM